MADIIETAINTGSLNTLVKAVEAAGLVYLLKGEGPFTVFAPADTAFDRMPPGELDKLLHDRTRLKKTLEYHIVPGAVTIELFMEDEIDEAPTVEGSPLAIDSSNGCRVNQALVTTPNILADNGVIHVIDSILIPG